MPVQLHLVTVLYNSPEVLPGFFESLAKQREIQFHLYLIDNSTGPESGAAAAALIEQHQFTNTTYVANPSNVGVAAGNNQGIVLALSDAASYVLLLNNDIEFEDPLLLKKMLNTAESGRHALMVPKIFFFEKPLIWCAGGDINRLTGVTSHFGEHCIDNESYSISRQVRYAPTCFMLIKSDVFAKAGLMDEQYFVYSDDTDFVWRCSQKDIALYYWADGQVRHKVSTSTGGGESPFTKYYTTRNRIYFVRKHFGLLHQFLALSYFFVTRPLKTDFWNAKNRSILGRAVRDSFKMSIPR